MQRVLQLWGKTSGNGAYHPAVFHMIDAGHVAAELLGRKGPLRFRTVLANAFGVDDPDSLVSWLPLVVALHDLGKVSSIFQRQVPEQHERLIGLGVTFPPAGQIQGVRHQHVSAASLRFEMRDGLLAALKPVEPVLFEVTGGHHGQFVPMGADSGRSAKLLVTSVESSEWRGYREEAVAMLLSIFPLETGFVAPSPPDVRAASLALTGFTILCDWLASDGSVFTATPDAALEAYLPVSRERAAEAVEHAGFRSPSREIIWRGFRGAFPGITTLRPLQEAIDEMAGEVDPGPSLTIIEAPTGEGKTEAALALAWWMAATTGYDDLYVALPTMATSNQIFKRVAAFLKKNAGEDTATKLIHGQAFLVEDDLLLEINDDLAGDESPAKSAGSWFAPRKRALLAPYGVGTVDQAELAVLSTRHYMLRLFGLAGKVIIIDEVHAYDAYMSTIIDHALTWLAALGSPVILLSATLPANRHREMARAYLRGLSGGNTDPSIKLPESSLPYPVIARYGASAHSFSAPKASQPLRQLSIRLVQEGSAKEESEHLLACVANGGAVCRMTNTVRRAQEIYRELLNMAPEGVQHRLIHARIPLNDRLNRESDIAQLLGPDADRRATDRIIIVGTQVLEQSLDYDVDYMITDLAPVDLLLQRAGRLHRHAFRDAIRPDRFRNPVLAVAVGEIDDAGLPHLGDSRYIYEPFTLLKTWLELGKRTDGDGRITVNLPEDYRSLIEAVYDDMVDESHPGARRIRNALQDALANKTEMQQFAKGVLIPDLEPGVLLTMERTLCFVEDENAASNAWGKASTRFGSESINVIPLYRVPGGIAMEPDGDPVHHHLSRRETQLQLLQRGMRVANRSVVRQLPKMFDAELPAWEDAVLLRGSHPLVLEGGELHLDALTIRMTPELGLEYVHKRGETP